jgi:hypothetical protein
MLRGAARPIQLYRLAQREARRDPARGRIVEEPPAARLRQGDEELWFCSEQCLRDYLGSSRTDLGRLSGGLASPHTLDDARLRAADLFDLESDVG